MLVGTLRDRCRSRFLAGAEERRRAMGAPLLATATLRDVAEGVAEAEAAALDDAALLRLVAGEPALLDRMAGGTEEPLRDLLRGVVAQDALLHIEGDLEAVLAAGQDTSTLPVAVAAAVAALDRAIAGRRVGFANRDAVANLLAGVDEFDTPLYGALCAKVAATLREAGDPVPAETLLAAQEARGAVLSRSAGAHP